MRPSSRIPDPYSTGDASTRYQFTGTVKGDTIEGMVKVGDGVTQQQLPWSAKIVQRVAGPQ